MILKSEINSHLLVTFIYFLLVSLLRWKFDLSYFWLWTGALLGTFFLDIDHLVYWFITHPEEKDSIEAREIWSGGRTRGARWTRRTRETIERLKELYLLGQKFHDTHNQLIFHSVVGQTILFLLTFYILSSGGSIFASAFMMSINLHLLKDEWQGFFVDKKNLSDWLFWQIKGMPKEKYLGVYLGGVSLLFLGLTLFFYRGW